MELMERRELELGRIKDRVQPRRIHSVDFKRYKSNNVRKGNLQQKTRQDILSESKRLPLQQKMRRNDHSIITMIPYYIERIQRS